MRLPFSRFRYSLALLSGLLMLAWASPATAQYALVTNLDSGSIVLLDTATNEVIGFKKLGAYAIGCAISRDQTTGYVTTAFGPVLVFDLPSLRLRETIDTSILDGEILVDGVNRALVAGLDSESISVIDLRRSREVSLSTGPAGFSGIAQDGGHVLAATSAYGPGRPETHAAAVHPQPLQLLKWKPSQRFGSLMNTGRGIDLAGGLAHNPVIAPGSGSGAVIDIVAGRVVSFTLPRMKAASAIQPRLLGKDTIESIEFHPSGSTLFVKSSSVVWAYAFDTATGKIGREMWRTNVQQGGLLILAGLDSLLPVGDRLFVLQPGHAGLLGPSTGPTIGTPAPRGSIRVLDAWTGATQREIRDYKLAGWMLDICGPAR